MIEKSDAMQSRPVLPASTAIWMEYHVNQGQERDESEWPIPTKTESPTEHDPRSKAPLDSQARQEARITSRSGCLQLDESAAPSSAEFSHWKIGNSAGALDASAAFGHPPGSAIPAGEGCSQTPSSGREPSAGRFVDDRSVSYRPLNHHFSHHGDGQTVPGSSAEAQAPVYGKG